MFFVRSIQLIFVAIPIVLFGWLATQWMVPSGVFFVSHEVGDSSAFIDSLKPNQRVLPVESMNGESRQAIVDDPVFFFLHPHRSFEQIDLEVWFQNDQLPLIEIGGLTSTQPERYTLKPLHNNVIDQSDWHRIDAAGMVLLQREQKYENLEDFYTNPPARERVATYRAELSTPYRMSGYAPKSVAQTIEASLRGHHEFKTYIKDENLRFTFEYQDMNRDEGPDAFQALVFNEEGLPVAEARAADDGNDSDDQQATGLERAELNVGGLDEGVYKVVINTTRDVFIRKIHTTQQKLVFLNTIYIGDEVGYREDPQGATLWTGTEYASMQTRHAGGVQEVQVDGDVLSISEPYEWYETELGAGVSSIALPAGDVEVVLEGKIALNKNQYFNPDPVNITAYSSLEDLGVDYVLAQYRSPREEGDWLVATVSFSSEELFAEEDGTWKISFSTPRIEDIEAEVFIHQINTWFYRELGDWEDLSQLFSGQ